jgi:hypothetical protein
MTMLEDAEVMARARAALLETLRDQGHALRGLDLFALCRSKYPRQKWTLVVLQGVLLELLDNREVKLGPRLWISLE